MKKLLKWIVIILSGLIVLLIILCAAVLIKHDRYGLFPSGGTLSENQSKYDVLFYNLNLEIFSNKQAIAGFVTVKIRALEDSLEMVELDLIDNFDVSRVLDQSDNSLSFKHNDNLILVNPATPLKKDEILDLKVEYSGQPVQAIKPPWIGGFNWSRDSLGNDWIGVSCQSEGAKIWFPCKDHPSDEPDSAAINITIPKEYYCASNGLLRDISTPRAGFRTFHWFTGYPINNYNINISIGKYEILSREYKTLDNRVMPVYYYVLPEARAGADELIDMAVDMLYTYRKYYGEYPFTTEKFAIVHTDYLGMEHQTINAYGNDYQYTDLNGVKWDWLMLHEMGHEWWGNKLTAADFADLWLHEGICSYGESLFQLEKAGEGAYHEFMAKTKSKIRNSAPIIPKRNATTLDVYRGDIYTKGAYLMHSLRYILGDSLFFPTLKEFATDSQYTYQNLVTTDDFIQLINKNSGRDYSQLLKFYLYTTDYPQIKIDSSDVNEYHVSIPNIDFTIPMEITLDNGSQQVELGSEPTMFHSQMKPLVDEGEWFLKEFIK